MLRLEKEKINQKKAGPLFQDHPYYLQNIYLWLPALCSIYFIL